MFIELHNGNLINLDLVKMIYCKKDEEDSEPYHLNFLFGENELVTLTYHSEEKMLLAKKNLKKFILEDKKLINYLELLGDYNAKS